MATKHVSRKPQSIVESVPSSMDITSIPTPDGGLLLANLSADKLRFRGERATYLVVPIPIDRLYGPHFIDQSAGDEWYRYTIYRAASIRSSNIDLSAEFGANAIAFSPDVMQLMLLDESRLRMGGYRRLANLRPIKVLEVSIV